MKAPGIKEIKTELNHLHPARLLEICLKMGKYKKENKELLTYLLFDSSDESMYIREIKLEMDTMFLEVNKSNSYIARKNIRKILAFVNKQIKFSGLKVTEIELLIHFCKKIKKSGHPLHLNSALGNIYLRQIQKIKKALSTLHEDLQFDYAEELRIL
jgi:hypothetical protein